MRYGALGDIAVFVLAVVGMYLTDPGANRRLARTPSEPW